MRKTNYPDIIIDAIERRRIIELRYKDVRRRVRPISSVMSARALLPSAPGRLPERVPGGVCFMSMISAI
ncbi:hypothetical protein F4V91_05045 [Neorhizobium galegae]|uniref:Uncharacterized protein n=1 Tax=Neorhizobium galegae TaxID=399 RepID=A0A6A1TQC5_NEOGA|nr:hypothetical protein [Neorhizobium galegae]KAB1085854.1 hypothetical protein F4V91_05045 [Neorhizobium galegae]